MVTLDEAIQSVKERFPFEGYVDPERIPYHHIISTVLRHLSPGSRILDLGSGPCDKTAILQMLGFKCSAYDDLQDDWHKLLGNRDKIIAFAKDCGIDFRLADDGAPPFEKNSFDMLMMLDVLEHLHDSPRDLLNDMLEFVKPEGLLFATVPNAVNIRKRIAVFFGGTNLARFESYYWYPGPWRGHVREYVKDDLVKLSEYLNLEIIEAKACDQMLQILPARVRLIYRAITSVFKGWKDSWMLVAKKRPGWAPKKSIPKDEFKAIIGRYTAYLY